MKSLIHSKKNSSRTHIELAYICTDNIYNSLYIVISVSMALSSVTSVSIGLFAVRSLHPTFVSTNKDNKLASNNI